MVVSKRINWSVHAAADILSAMGNSRRLQALMYLAKGETTVNEMADAIGMTQSSLSQHLAVLRRTNLVKTRRSAQTIYYTLDSLPVTKILGVLNETFNGDDKVEIDNRGYLEHSI